MAKLVNNGAGTTFSTAANWDTITNTPTLHASTNITIGSSSYYSATFTAPNTSNKSTGVIVYCGSNTNTAGTITAYLQENSAGWVDRANSGSITASTISPYGFYYFRWSTPYTFAATTAGYYRIKLTGSGMSGAITMAADSGGSNFAYLHSDDRHTAPAIATDDIWVMGANGTARTITVDGTSGGVGTAASTANAVTNTFQVTTQAGESRSLLNAIYIGEDGTLDWDNTADSTLTVRGNIAIGPMGTWQMDGSSDQTVNLNLIFDLTSCTTTTGGFGVGKHRSGYSILQGAPKSSTSLWKTTIASGVGTAADPVIMTDAVDWIVGDEILIPASSDRSTNVTESETRFIITKNSSTSYVWSDTAGGSESAITAAYHTLTTYALNITRNVRISAINGSSPTLIGTYYFGHDISTSTCDWDWIRWSKSGSTSSAGAGGVAGTGKEGITLGINSDAVLDARYVVLDNVLFRGITMSGPSNPGYDTTGWIVCNCPNNYGGGGVNYFGGKSQTHTDFWVVNCYNGGWYSVSQSNTFTRCFVIGCNGRDQFNRGGFVGFNEINNTYQNCEAHCNKRSGFTSWGTVLNKFIDCQGGTKGLNSPYQVIANGSGTDTGFRYYHDFLLDRFLSPDASPTSTFGFGLYMLPGSEVKFNDYNGTVGENHWFTRYGNARTTTTNARTASSKCIEITPLNSTDGFTYDFLILARANTAVQALGFVKKHTIPVGSVVTVSLFLPGSTTADYVQTMPDNDSWNPFVVYGNYTGSVDLFARVEINVKATSGLFLIDDIFNGTNNITALDASFEAKPSPVMFEQLGDAAAVWAVPTAILTTAGTTGKKLADDLTTDEFLALK